MLRPGSPLSRCLAVLLVLVVLYAGHRLLVMPIVSAYRAAAASIEQSTRLLDRYRALAGQRAELATLVEDYESAARDGSAYLEGSNHALATATLQDKVSLTIADAGGELRSTRVLPAEPVEAVAGISAAGLRLDLSIDIAGLEAMLYRIETGEPYLFIDQITIRERRRRSRNPRGQPDSKPELDVSLTVHGYVRTVEA